MFKKDPVNMEIKAMLKGYPLLIRAVAKPFLKIALKKAQKYQGIAKDLPQQFLQHKSDIQGIVGEVSRFGENVRSSISPSSNHGNPSGLYNRSGYTAHSELGSPVQSVRQDGGNTPKTNLYSGGLSSRPSRTGNEELYSSVSRPSVGGSSYGSDIPRQPSRTNLYDGKVTRQPSRTGSSELNPTFSNQTSSYRSTKSKHKKGIIARVKGLLGIDKPSFPARTQVTKKTQDIYHVSRPRT